MDEIKLKPCPFCGGKADILGENKYLPGTIVHCTECQVETPMYKNREDAIKAWNRRVQDE